MSLIVADIGNSRIKWGRCSGGAIVEHVSLPSDDPASWAEQERAWDLGDAEWAVASVQPRTSDRLVHWLRDRGKTVRVIDSPTQVPIAVAIDHPERVGLDRLLDAVAANVRRPAHQSAVIVDAGTAVTVDLVDASGAFRGGAIMPGLHLMAQSLHDHTALLPVIDIRTRRPPPGTSTTAAIETGVFHAVVGGIDRLLADLDDGHRCVFITGGDAELLAPHLKTASCIVWPEMTLEGIRMSVSEPRP